MGIQMRRTTFTKDENNNCFFNCIKQSYDNFANIGTLNPISCWMWNSKLIIVSQGDAVTKSWKQFLNLQKNAELWNRLMIWFLCGNLSTAHTLNRFDTEGGKDMSNQN